MLVTASTSRSRRVRKKQKPRPALAARLSPVDIDNLVVLGGSRPPPALIERVKTTADAIADDEVRKQVSRDTSRRLLEALFEADLDSTQREDRELRMAVGSVLEFCEGYLDRGQRHRMIGLSQQAGFEDCKRFLTAPVAAPAN